MRFFPALFGALLITVAVFLFMQSLIQRGKDESVQLVVHSDVQILRQEPQEEPEQDPDTPEEPPEEPLMDALPAMEISSAGTAAWLTNWNCRHWISVSDDSIFSRPVSAGALLWRPAVSRSPPVAQDAQGFVEVVPFNTRRPNVPDVAWQNKINGWVLVAFSVTGPG